MAIYYTVGQFCFKNIFKASTLKFTLNTFHCPPHDSKCLTSSLIFFNYVLHTISLNPLITLILPAHTPPTTVSAQISRVIQPVQSERGHLPPLYILSSNHRT